jgi:hypothetical protein
LFVGWVGDEQVRGNNSRLTDSGNTGRLGGRRVGEGAVVGGDDESSVVGSKIGVKSFVYGY